MPKGISMKSRYDASKFKEKASPGDKVLKIKLGP